MMKLSTYPLGARVAPSSQGPVNKSRLSEEGGTGPPITLPASLESLPRAEHFPTQRHRWNTNEEIAAVLINFERHPEWLFKEVKIRPKSGSMLLYSRKKVRYRRDGYCWKKRKDGKTTREDHMKLKVQGTECIYGCYVHSAILPTFHRRCYWLLQNPDIVLVHYLNVPYPDDAKLLVVASVSLWAERKEWSKEELISQLRPMFLSQDEPNLNNELEVSTAETVEAIVTQLMEKQRLARSGNPAPPNGHPGGQQPARGANGRAEPKPGDDHAHSLRRVPSGGSFVRLEPRPPPASGAHSSGLPNQISQADPVYDAIAIRPLEQQQQNGFGRGASPPMSSTPGASFGHHHHHHHLHHQQQQQQHHVRTEPEMQQQQQQQQQQQLVAAKQESIDYYYNGGAGASSGIQGQVAYLENAAGSVDSGIGSSSGVFPPFYSLGQPAPARRTDEMLAGYRLPGDCMFNETLDLSHDDIQRTLSANLSHETAFLCGPAADRRPPDVPVTADDDLLANLDAFDMLAEFSDLDCPDAIDELAIQQHEPDEGAGPAKQRAAKEPDCEQPAQQQRPLAEITDFSPEWAPTEGGSKILVTGSFCSPGTDPYSVSFGGLLVPAVWVQLGVLRCYCPPHGPGRVELHVARQGLPVTRPVAFEYRQVSTALGEPASGQQWTNSLLSVMLVRLEALGRHLDLQGSGIEQLFDSLRAYLESGEVETQSTEEQLVSICRQLVAKRWKSPEETAPFERADHAAMNLLHLAAAVGLLRVLCTLLNWRLENSSALLEREMNPLAIDRQGYTPLMWACANGHRDVVALLAQWDPSALDVTDRAGRSAWDVARQRGHHALAAELESRRILSVRRSAGADGPSPSAGKCPGRAAERQMLMAKRSSVDSAPNNGQSDPQQQPGGYWRRPNAARAHKLSRDERSYSLPLGGPAYSSGRNSTGSNISSLANDPSPSPLMDSNSCGGTRPARRDSSSDAQAQQQHLSPLTCIEQNTRVLTLAEQIIAAIPDRIKNETEDMVVSWSPCVEMEGSVISEAQSVDNSIDLTIVTDPPSLDANDMTFDFNDQQYRYCETATPSSSLSPASSSCLQSPCSFSVNSPSPPPTTADFSEFLQASTNMFVRDFSNLTLSDHEQRELYEAAKTIQKAYRSYVGRKRAEEQEKERAAAVIIQNYYRRYKQYVYLKQMTKAAVVIQNQFRSYYEHKRFKKNMESSTDAGQGSGNGGPTMSSASAAAAVAAAYRNYRETSAGSGRQSREGTPTSSALKRTYSQRRQHQAARKIQQFMRQSKNNLLDVVVKSVAEREGLANGGRVGASGGAGSGPAATSGGLNGLTFSSADGTGPSALTFQLH